MNSTALKARADELQAAITPLQRELDRVNKLLRKSLSRDFIALHGITRADVARPTLSMHTLFEFIDGPLTASTKPFAEWNGLIYHRVELLAGRLTATPADYDDIPEAKP